MPPEEEGAEQKSGSKRTLFIIIGAVAIFVILFAVTKAKSPSEAAPTLTLAGVDSEVTAIDSRLGAAEGTVAQHTEDIADLESDVNEFGGFPDWSQNINDLENRMTTEETNRAAIQSDLDSLQAELNSLNTTGAEIDSINATLQNLIESFDSWTPPPYVEITGVGANLDAAVAGTGEFAIIFTLYGENLTNVINFYPEVYSMTWFGSNTTVTAVCEADWDNDEIKLAVTGDVHYASVSIGGS